MVSESTGQREVIILGSTGSIGTQALEVISTRTDQFKVVGLAAGGGNIDLLAKQVRDFAVPVVAVASKIAGDQLANALAGHRVEILAGPDAAADLAGYPADVVLNGITGSAGLKPTLATLKAGTILALANKESLVIGGKLVKDAAKPGQIVAVDSEHSAFAQALRCGKASEVKKLILTASGGPFRGMSREQLRDVTPEQALAHPTWNMGRVITINSSTLVNKGLELIEAALLYDVDLDQVEVVVHPQSAVHSGVEFHDGATIMQCSPPDMRLAIALGLTWPDRVAGAAKTFDWSMSQNWTFEPLDAEAFPAVELARKAGKASGSAPAVFNGANEVCVDAFCDHKIGFLDITDTLARILDQHLETNFVPAEDLTLEKLLDIDAWARQRALELTAGS